MLKEGITIQEFDLNEIDFASLNSLMGELMDDLREINKTLSPMQQLPDVLFLALTWGVYEWRQMMAKNAIGNDEDTDDLLELLAWWREKSGYNDLHFIKDRFEQYLTIEDKRVITTFEAWGSERHFFEWIAELQKEDA